MTQTAGQKTWLWGKRSKRSFNRIWPFCWACSCTACFSHRNCGKLSCCHSPGMVQGGTRVMGMGINRCNFTARTSSVTMMLSNTHFFFLPSSLVAGFLERSLIKPSLVHSDLTRYSLNIPGCINYHCCTSATEEAKCFPFAQAEYLFKTFLVSLGTNQNIVYDSYEENTKKTPTCCLSIQFFNNIAVMS